MLKSRRHNRTAVRSRRVVQQIAYRVMLWRDSGLPNPARRSWRPSMKCSPTSVPAINGSVGTPGTLRPLQAYQQPLPKLLSLDVVALRHYIPSCRLRRSWDIARARRTSSAFSRKTASVRADRTTSPPAAVRTRGCAPSNKVANRVEAGITLHHFRPRSGVAFCP